ncbi:MAG TPA: hypothetical protein VGC41_10910 [Kofleriaceae bacterium]
MAKLRKTLPKNFEDLVEANDFAALTEALARCEVDARTADFAKRTALHHKCSAKLTRWLVERGADIDAEDTWGNAPLHNRITYGGDIDILIELGADLEHQSRSIGRPLHNAADAGVRIEAATKLLDAGANVDGLSKDGKTPLESALARASNVALIAMVEMARLLLARGAKIRPGMAKSITRIGEEFEFHRANFNKDTVESHSNALDELYEIFDVTPVPRRVMHDGGRITVTSKTWQKQHEELWNLLIPSTGPATTVQGEVVRIAGRIGDELRRNGGGNWDKNYRAMANAYLAHIATGKALSASDQEAAAAVVKSLPGLSSEFDELARLGVKWVLANPEPVKLAKPSYKR